MKVEGDKRTEVIEQISAEMGSGQPMGLLKTYNDQMGAWDINLLVGGFETEEQADAAIELIKGILIADGFAKKLERIQ